MNELINKMLEINKFKNINLVNFALNYASKDITFHKDSLLLRGISDRPWVYISLSKDEDLFDITKNIKKDDLYFTIQDDIVLEYFKKNMEIEWLLECKKFVYENQEYLPHNHEIVTLTCKDAKYIQDNNVYGEYTSVEYINQRITDGLGLGIKVNNVLVAWAITHDDGAIGFMNVLKEYRGLGYAKALTIESINRINKENSIPFVHIEPNNDKSISLAKKMGFTFYGNIYWIKIK